MNTFWLKIAGLAVVVLGLIILVAVLLPSKPQPVEEPENERQVRELGDTKLPPQAKPEPPKAIPAGVKTVELTLHPAKAAEPAEKYQLLPKADEQSNADGVPLYEKAAQSLPKDPQIDERIRTWRETPLDKLPHKQVQSTLQQLRATLQLVEQAARCKQCNWPPFEPQTLPENLSEYRKIAFALAIQARLQIAQGQYDQAVRTIQTGCAMARHLSEAPNLTQGLVGVSIAAYMCRQLEQFIQPPDSPNLYHALNALPKPPVDLTKTIEFEIENLKQYNVLVRKQFEKQLKPAHDRVRLIMNRLNRHVTALQCLEALRLYAGAHDGKFPNELSSVTEVAIPDDPITQQLFVYGRTGSKAILEGPPPEGEGAEEGIRYELTLKE